MTSISVDDSLAARLAERARRAGMTVEALAEEAIQDYLEESAPAAGDVDAYAFFGRGSNPDVQARDADELFGDEFGR